MIFRVLVWLSSLCPFGVRHDFLHPCYRRPLERGSLRLSKRHIIKHTLILPYYVLLFIRLCCCTYVDIVVRQRPFPFRGGGRGEV